MAREPETRYAKAAGGNVAYQVVGDGPLDLVVAPGWVSHVDLLWRDPGWERFIGGFASFARVILFDHRGTGLSDPVDRVPTLENRMDDLRAAMDAAGSERAALFGLSEGGPLSVLFAASYPERTIALVLYGTFATGSVEDDGSPGRAGWIKAMAAVRDSIDHWGEGRNIDWAAPSLSRSALQRRAVGALERASMSPAMALLSLEAAIAQCDVRSILENVSVPTLVLHRRKEAIPVEYGRYLAGHIPGARLVELDGVDHAPQVGDVESITGEVEEFLTGMRHTHEPDRVLATVLFTDIVGSTQRAAELGDRAWRELLERHDEIARAAIGRFRGREVKHTGDGFLATFDGPARAVRCAFAIGEEVRALGIEIRSGVHTGECELRGDDLGGIAVHVGARIEALAGPSEVLVSSTVKDLVVGSGIAFGDRGMHSLKGVPGEWRLFVAAGEDTRLANLPPPPDPVQDPLIDRIAHRPRLARVLARATFRH
jgi:class 3 adenylate cyclase